MFKVSWTNIIWRYAGVSLASNINLMQQDLVWRQYNCQIDNVTKMIKIESEIVNNDEPPKREALSRSSEQ